MNVGYAWPNADIERVDVFGKTSLNLPKLNIGGTAIVLFDIKSSIQAMNSAFVAIGELSFPKAHSMNYLIEPMLPFVLYSDKAVVNFSCSVSCFG